MKHLIVLTYSFRDIRRVRRLRDALRRYGLDVWPDKTLTPGTPAWHAEVDTRLNEALCVIVVLSKDAVVSGWVQRVIDSARRRPVTILPVVIDGEPGHKLLVELEGETWFDLRWSKHYLAEVRGLVAFVHQLVDASVAKVQP